MNEAETRLFRTVAYYQRTGPHYDNCTHTKELEAMRRAVAHTGKIERNFMKEFA